ncbi:Hypothetical_protein [Hexamita inflata]|uniref:Hypothetical_protein n=1 Tax=Hexamita inflata TaxID=28002 RepID=A0ABP1GZ41_9EUKA
MLTGLIKSESSACRHAALVFSTLSHELHNFCIFKQLLSVTVYQAHNFLTESTSFQRAYALRSILQSSQTRPALAKACRSEEVRRGEEEVGRTEEMMSVTCLL